MSATYFQRDYLDPVLILEFPISASRDRVYDAWTNIEIFKQWFRPKDFTIAKAEMHAEAGGYFRIHMQSPDGDIYPTKGEYILLDPPNRIVYKDSWDDDRENNSPVVAEVVFLPNGEGWMSLERKIS